MKPVQPDTNPNFTPPSTIWNPMFLSIFFANIALNLGQQMSNSLLSLYAKSTGAPADQIGQLMSMFAVTALIFRFISGPAMNSYNRKKLLMLAMTCMGTAYLGFSFSPESSAPQRSPLLTCRPPVCPPQGSARLYCILLLIFPIFHHKAGELRL